MNTNTMITFAEMLVNAYNVESKKDAERLDYARSLIAHEVENLERGEKADTGIFGKVFEVLSRPSTSRLVKIQTQGKTDSRKRISRVSETIELKSGDGRIESLFGSKASHYVVYVGFYQEMIKGEKYKRMTKAIILPREVFLEGAGTITTISRHSDGERFVRCSSKFAKAINEWAIEYDRNATYTAEMFEGLTL